MWLFIDNYDSFSHILLDYLKQIYDDIKWVQNDSHSLPEIIAMNPERIIISPGPKTPNDAGVILEVIAHFHDKLPILGICLGHQALAQYLGATISTASYPMHGKVSVLEHYDMGIFENWPPNSSVMRYHSLEVKKIEGTGIVVWARAQDDQSIMAFGHDRYPLVGLQFHPEAALTDNGLGLLRSWDQFIQSKTIK